MCTRPSLGLAACTVLHGAGPTNIVVTSVAQPTFIMVLVARGDTVVLAENDNNDSKISV
jgi:hypothetical protein